MPLIEKAIMGLFGKKHVVKQANVRLKVQDQILEHPQKKEALSYLEQVWSKQQPYVSLLLDHPINQVITLTFFRREEEMIIQAEIEEENGSSLVERICHDANACERVLCLFFDFGVVDSLECYHESR